MTGGSENELANSTRYSPIVGAGKTQHHSNSAESSWRRHFRLFFSNFDKCRPEAADDVLSIRAVDNAGMDALVKFGDST